MPYWKGKTLEDKVEQIIGKERSLIGKVAKINQTDHAQGHICPNTQAWLQKGPYGLMADAKANAAICKPEQKEFYQAVEIVLQGAALFIERYEMLARQLAAGEADQAQRQEYLDIADICGYIKEKPAESFRQAVQATWFLYVLLQMESNASSFSPGRMEQICL